MLHQQVATPHRGGLRGPPAAAAPSAGRSADLYGEFEIGSGGSQGEEHPVRELGGLVAWKLVTVQQGAMRGLEVNAVDAAVAVVHDGKVHTGDARGIEDDIGKASLPTEDRPRLEVRLVDGTVGSDEAATLLGLRGPPVVGGSEGREWGSGEFPLLRCWLRLQRFEGLRGGEPSGNPVGKVVCLDPMGVGQTYEGGSNAMNQKRMGNTRKILKSLRATPSRLSGRINWII